MGSASDIWQYLKVLLLLAMKSERIWLLCGENEVNKLWIG